MTEPEPPQGVAAVMADGRRIPLECTYAGLIDGTHLWQAVLNLPEQPRSISVRGLPANTSVSLAWAVP